jgi:hypothetical protein
MYRDVVCTAHTTALRYTTQTAYRFGHQKAVLTIVLLKMDLLMLEKRVESINQHFVASSWFLSYIMAYTISWKSPN